MTVPDAMALGLRAPANESGHDDELLVAAARCDPAAFGTLYERYYERVYRYCRARSPSHEDGADLTQQVFVLAFRGLQRYRPTRSGFAAWLFTIARNAVTDAHRRRRQTVSWGENEEASSHLAPGPGPEEAVLVNEELDRLRSALGRLTPQQRDVLALRFAVGLSVRDVASVIGTSEPAAQMRLSRALHAIRKEG